MQLNKKKYFIFCILFILVILILLFAIKRFEKNKTAEKEPIIINLLTSVHPSLPWSFKAVSSTIEVQPGEVKTIEYIVENLSDKESTGIATFAYFPNQIGSYIRKLNCFCYDAQTLKSQQQDTYSIVLLVDPEVTKDSKTKNIKEVTIQFTFFDYKEYKENKN